MESPVFPQQTHFNTSDINSFESSRSFILMLEKTVEVNQPRDNVYFFTCLPILSITLILNSGGRHPAEGALRLEQADHLRLHGEHGHHVPLGRPPVTLVHWLARMGLPNLQPDLQNVKLFVKTCLLLTLFMSKKFPQKFCRNHSFLCKNYKQFIFYLSSWSDFPRAVKVTGFAWTSINWQLSIHIVLALI